MRWLAVVGIALANNLDNAGIGVTFGIARIRLSPLINLWISLVTFGITAAATALGSHLASFMAWHLAHLLSAILFCAMGAWMILSSLRGQREPPEPANPSGALSLRRILADPTSADRNASHDIDLGEATLIAIAASLNNLGGGLVAGLGQLSAFWIAFCSALVSFLALWFGGWAGQRLGATRLAEHANVIAGILLLVIGLGQFR